MRFFPDHYFHTGLMHITSGKPCQDYAISGGLQDGAFAVIADGCSSGGHTDVGARLISLATASVIREYQSVNGFVNDKSPAGIINLRQRIVLSGIRQTLGLDLNDMLATCAYLYLTPDGGVAHARGDGAFAFSRRDGAVVMTRWNWAGNMPFYPAYAEDNYSSFISAHGGDSDALVLTEENWMYFPDGSPDAGFKEAGRASLRLKDGIEGITLFFDAAFLNDIGFIGLFSDGIAQVDNVDWKQAVLELFAFKSVAGEFAKRRMIRFIKDSQKTGKGPVDDIAYAVIRVASGDQEAKEA